ncbi:hypothetical protein MTR_8g104300 [Medicago truncatula]|uniref:Uncharacterized protein n=1 Tax=Medicago truncatula TaxID=3880 RepID=G7L9Q5_MEDTR|nr:hypothetical protein MTR_8g104300 [Medicago truncatula]
MAFGQIMDLVTYFRTSKMFSAKSALWGPLNGSLVVCGDGQNERKKEKLFERWCKRCARLCLFREKFYCPFTDCSSLLIRKCGNYKFRMSS